jgi:hypothetical protein
MTNHIVLKRRSIPDRLRYCAEKLREGTDPNSIAILLDTTADELDNA